MTSQTAQTSSPKPEPSIVRLDPALDALIPPGAKPELVATGFGFTEGPQFRHGRLWFVDGPQNKLRAVTPDGPARRAQPPQPRPAPRDIPRPWTKSQEKLALLYNEQGRRPDEIAQKLGLSTYLVSQIILSSRNRGKL